MQEQTLWHWVATAAIGLFVIPFGLLYSANNLGDNYAKQN